MARIAIIAGGGALPRLVTEGCRKRGYESLVIALKGFTDPAWCDDHAHEWFRLGQVGGILQALKKHKIDSVVFAGHIKRPSFRTLWSQFRPDLQAVKLFFQLRRHKMGDDALLRNIAGFLEGHGLKIVGPNDLVSDSLMPQGILTAVMPQDDEWKDIHYASHILRAWAELDQGQSIVVQHGLILGIEAAEGTDELIRRCKMYKRSGTGPILVKIKKPQQDRRMDMPTIGAATIARAIESGFAGIAVQSEEAIFLDPISAIQEADKAGLFIIGFEPKTSS